jgi:outer membrane OprD family porin
MESVAGPSVVTRSQPKRNSVCRLPGLTLVLSLSLASATAAGDVNDAMSNVPAGIEPIVHVRTYYWDSQDTSGSRSEAWAFGGWAGLKTRWYGDMLQLGVLGYTSQKLYGPANEGGSQLLQPDQDPITVLGQAYASARYAGQTLTVYRQMIDQPWVNPYDTRMIPNLFEGYLQSGKLADLEYIGGYVTKFKARDSNAFAWMSSAAGSTGPQQGMVLLGARLPMADGGYLRIAEQYLVDTYNTAYVDGDYPILVGAGDRLRLRGQYANQQSVGSAGLGVFNTWMYGIGALFERGPATIQVAWTQTSHNHNTQSAFGANPSFLHMMQVDFNDADEKAWLIGAALDLSAMGLAGLKVAAVYGNGHGAIDSTTGAKLGNRNETDLTLAYVFDKASRLQGLSFGVEGSWLNQVGAAAQGRQLRAFANYSVQFDLR